MTMILLLMVHAVAVAQLIPDRAAVARFEKIMAASAAM